MSRKPIDQQQPTECRQAIWEWIKARKAPFIASDLLYDIRLDASSINEYLTGLVNAGYLERTGNFRNITASTYTLINDTGHDAPRVRKDGTPVTQGRGREQMWQSMRRLKEFSVDELKFDASIGGVIVAESEAKSYCAAICMPATVILPYSAP